MCYAEYRFLLKREKTPYFKLSVCARMDSQWRACNTMLFVTISRNMLLTTVYNLYSLVYWQWVYWNCSHENVLIHSFKEAINNGSPLFSIPVHPGLQCSLYQWIRLLNRLNAAIIHWFRGSALLDSISGCFSCCSRFHLSSCPRFPSLITLQHVFIFCWTLGELNLCPDPLGHAAKHIVVTYLSSTAFFFNLFCCCFFS